MPEVLLSFISVFIALAVTLFGVWLALRRWQARFHGTQKGNLKINEMVALGGNWRAAVLEHDNKRFLIVYGNAGVSVTALDS